MSDSRSTPKDMRNRSQSPVKLRDVDGSPNMKDFIVIDKELIKGLSEKEVELEHLKTVIVGLNEKLKVKEDIEEDLYNARKQLDENDRARTVLHHHLEDAARRALEEAEKNKKYQDIIINENKELGQKITHQMGVINQKQEEIERLRNMLNQRDREANELKRLLADMEQIKKQNEQYKADIHDSNNKRKDLQTKFESALKDHQKQLDKEYQERQQLIKEKDDTTNKLRAAEKKISEQGNVIDKQRLDITERDNEIARLLNLLAIMDDIKNQRDSLQTQLKQHQDARDQLSKQLEDLVRQAQELRAKDQAQFQELMAARKKVEDENIMKEKIINEKDQTIKIMTEKNLEMQQRINSLEAIAAIKDDLSEKLELANQLIEKLHSSKEKMQRELETASDYLLEQEEKTHKANQTALELLKQLKDAESEIEGLKQYVVDLKQRIAVYIPVRDDFVDKKLAEYINNYPERSKLKIMFMRESEGVYQFGSKRVCVRVDKDKINIRVGGGYLSIDEFLDIYTPQELDRIERKDPLKKFSEKVAIQKTLIGNELRESSPIRSPMRGKVTSPMNKQRTTTSPRKQNSLKQ